MHGAPPRSIGMALLVLVGFIGSGCAGLTTITAVTESSDLYVLSPKSSHSPDLPEVAVRLVVEEPTAASSVNTDRIAVKPNPYQVQYFPRARWVDRAPLMVQTVLVESFENTGKVVSVGRQAIGLSSDFTLVTELREFQAHAGESSDGPVTIIVQLNMKIVRQPEGFIVASKSFAREATADADDMLAIVGAFDLALGRTMGDAVDWTVREIASIAG